LFTLGDLDKTLAQKRVSSYNANPNLAQVFWGLLIIFMSLVPRANKCFRIRLFPFYSTIKVNTVGMHLAQKLRVDQRLSTEKALTMGFMKPPFILLGVLRNALPHSSSWLDIHKVHK